MFTPSEILGPSGRIAARLKNYEARQVQLEMAEAVDRAIRQRQHLVVEAGTGVGKSFAYLVPAILAAAGEQRKEAVNCKDESATQALEPNDPHPNPLPKGEWTRSRNLPKGEGTEKKTLSAGEGTESDEPRSLRVVVSTHTISLQEQLMEKDLPFLNSVIPLEFSAVLVKGRSNYISLRRLKNAVERMSSLFDDEEEMEQLRTLQKWSKKTADGSLADLDFRPMASVWDEVASDHGNCMGRQCPTYAQCFYYQARRRMQHAQILVANHALFFSDLALRMQNASILPDYDVVIFDEAHNMEAVAGDHLGLSVTNGQVDYILRKLYNDRTNKGLLVHRNFGDAQQAVMECRHRADRFFQSIDDWFAEHAGGNGRVREAKIVENRLSEGLEKLAGMLYRCGKELKKPEEKQDYSSAATRLGGLAAEIEDWRTQSLPDAVYWVESSKGKYRKRITLAGAPIDVGPLLREHLFQKVPTVIMTSATLSAGGRFDFFQSRIGLTQCKTLCLGSPFDYRRQAELILPSNMPDPTDDGPEYERQVCEMIRRYVARSRGRAFVLFTSYEMMKRTATALTPWLIEQDFALYSQAEGLPRSQMLALFKKNPARGAFRRGQFLAGRGRAGRGLGERDHHAAAVQRAGQAAFGSPLGGHPRGGRQSVPRLSTAGGDFEAQAGFWPPHTQQARHRDGRDSRSADSHKVLRQVVFVVAARLPAGGGIGHRMGKNCIRSVPTVLIMRVAVHALDFIESRLKVRGVEGRALGIYAY